MRGGWSLPLSEVDVARVAGDIDRLGYASIAGYFSENDLEPLRKLIYRTEDDPLGKYAKLQEPSYLAGTLLAELPVAPQFRTLCKRLYELGTGFTTQETGFYQVVRYLKGALGLKNSFRFHYDTYVLTVLIPIIIPDEGPQGDLLMFPNMRPIRRTYVQNVIDKLLVDNPISQWLLRALAKHRQLGLTRIKIQPGNVYFFWGYRSIHANEPCNSEKLRVTALLHFGDPYRASKARAFLRGARRLATA
jgi:hypothetical protein